MLAARCAGHVAADEVGGRSYAALPAGSKNVYGRLRNTEG